MKVYELKHLFFQHMGELVYSPKSLGLFYTYNDATQAVKHYITQPGFRENRDAFSIEPKRVNGSIVDNSVFEVIIYLHSEDYTTEAEIELGLYCNEIIAQNELERYCKNNFTLLSIQKLTVEKRTKYEHSKNT